MYRNLFLHQTWSRFNVVGIFVRIIIYILPIELPIVFPIELPIVLPIVSPIELPIVLPIVLPNVLPIGLPMRNRWRSTPICILKPLSNDVARGHFGPMLVHGASLGGHGAREGGRNH